jgi:two-component system, OmpR family, sensor kinase
MTDWRPASWRARSIRVRVTLWYLGILLGVLVVSGAAVYAGLERALRGEMDHALDLVALQVSDVSSRGRAELDSDALPPAYVASLYSPSGQLLGAGPGGQALPWDAGVAGEVLKGRDVWRSVIMRGQAWRVLARPVTAQGSVIALLQVGRSEEAIAGALEQLRMLLMALVPLALVLAGSVGLFLAGRALDPIDRITRTAAAIGADDMARRLPEEVGRTPDEVGRLAATFNRMLDRLEGAFHRQRQFTADASHELRTPLTLLLTQLEVTLARPRSEDEYRRVLVALREDVIRLQRLVNALLALARADAGRDRPAHERIDLGDLARQAVDGLQTLAAERGVRLAVGAEPGIVVHGDESRLMQLIVNLVDNAIAHTPSGTNVTVDVAMERDGSTAVLSVRDTGLGIAPEHLPHLFERFYRADPARAAGALGLGLAISRSIVEAHGGRIEAESRPGRGSTFTVKLPGRSEAGATDRGSATRVSS